MKLFAHSIITLSMNAFNWSWLISLNWQNQLFFILFIANKENFETGSLVMK
uniref:Uncharacterized protein n=1 Tax=uncultured Desulfobacterium sp. TaxID=201089 RepID=E1Y845_9BACT|nr:unknown protein [uncultured Desulfobacterium sp.]